MVCVCVVVCDVCVLVSIMVTNPLAMFIFASVELSRQELAEKTQLEEELLLEDLARLRSSAILELRR